MSQNETDDTETNSNAETANTEVMTLDQYREAVENHLNELQRYNERDDVDEEDEVVMMIGSMVGTAGGYGASSNYDAIRFNGQVGYDASLFADPNSVDPIDSFTNTAPFGTLFGSVAMPRRYLDEWRLSDALTETERLLEGNW